MQNPKTKQLLENLVKHTVEALKELAGKGQELNQDTILAIVAKRDEVIAHLSEYEKTIESVKQETEKETQIKNLDAQLKTAQNQKSVLLRQMGDLEEKEQFLNQFYRNTILFFIRFLNLTPDSPLGEAGLHIENLIKEEADTREIETSFLQFKDLSIKSDFSASETSEQKSKKSSMLARWFKTDKSGKESLPQDLETNQCILSLKQSYESILDELKLNLNEGYIQELINIQKKIRLAKNLENYDQIRADILDLIHELINRISVERQQTAAFIREINDKLAEVETHINDSFAIVIDTYQANDSFNVALKDHIEDISGMISISKTLAELKQTLVSKLTVLKSSIDEKHIKDKSRQANSDENMNALKHDLEHMKKEIDSARERARKLEQEVLTDPLTGAYNRRAYDRRIEEEFNRFTRYKRFFSLLVLDVDLFKNINDQYGHAVGDKCLQEIIRRVKPILRESDFLARYGGEEFAVILPETDGQGAKEVAEKIRTAIEKTEFLHKGNQVTITISVGATRIVESDPDYAAVFSRADQAVYKAKQNGRNRVEFI